MVQTRGQEIYAIRQIDGSPLWQQTLDGNVVGKPQVAEDNVYLLSDKQTFYAFDKETGAFRWVYRYRNGAIPPPVVSGQIVYSISHGYLKAFRADTGQLLWQTLFGKDHLISPISLSNDNIYLAVDNKTIFMLKRKDGSIGWHLPLSETLTSPLTVDGSRLYYSTNQNHLVARDNKSGTLLWQQELPSIVVNSHGQSHIYVSGHIIIYINQVNNMNPVENKILALNDATGSIIWNSILDGWPVRSATLSHDTVTLLTLNGTIVTLDLPSGNIRWRVALGNAYTASMAADNTTLYVYAVDGACDVLNAQSGFLLSHYRTNFLVTSPLIENDRVYMNIASTTDPQDIGVLAYNVKNGAHLWLYHTLLPLSTPTFSDQKVLVNDIQGKTYIFNAANGSLLNVLS